MSEAAAPTPEVRHVVLVVRMPDRPGALGSVASRIGSVGANITDVTVGRDADGVLDTFHLDLPPKGAIDTMDLLVSELDEADSSIIHQRVGDPGCCREDPAGPGTT